MDALRLSYVFFLAPFNFVRAVLPYMSTNTIVIFLQKLSVSVELSITSPNLRKCVSVVLAYQRHAFSILRELAAGACVKRLLSLFSLYVILMSLLTANEKMLETRTGVGPIWVPKLVNSHYKQKALPLAAVMISLFAVQTINTMNSL